jgi:hypothetical protein
MFELDLLVRMKIPILDEYNARLENGEPEAYLEFEQYLMRKLNENRPGEMKVTKLQIEDAGPYNDAGKWEPSKFHGDK